MRQLVLAMLFLASSVAAQSKVGTTGASFLEVVTSVPALGMGELELIVPEGTNFADNPALLPFSNSARFQVGGNPSWTDSRPQIHFYTSYASYGISYSGESVDSSAKPPVWRLCAAYRYEVMKSDPLLERTYGDADYEGTGRTFTAKDQLHQITIGVSRSGSNDFGIGVSVKQVKETFSDYSSSGVSFDAGAYGRVPIMRPGISRETGPAREVKLQLLFGAALTNFGPGMEFIGKKYPLPHCWRFSLGAEVSYRDFRVLAGVEQRRWPMDLVGSSHYGVEAEWRRTITLRSGYGRLDGGETEVTSLGAGLSTRGLFRLMTHGRRGMPFDLKIDYARTESASGIYDGRDSWWLQLEL